MTKHICRISILIAHFIAILFSISTLVGADDYEPNDYYASIGLTNNPNWMSKLPDDMLLSDLSIPGTHDSMAVWGNLGSQPATPTGLTDDITKVQQRFNENGRDSLFRQFQSGIRAIDIRVIFTYSSDNEDPIPVPQFAIHHGPVYQYANFYDTMRAASEFLSTNPSETILLRLKLESGSDDDSKNFPSVLQKYRDNRPIGEVFYEPSVNGNGSISVPRLGDVRGKMVLMTLLGKGGGTYGSFGINPDSIDTQDEYEFQLPNGAKQKFRYVVEQLEKTADPVNRDKIMINFVSATTKFGTFIPGFGVNGPAAIAHDINQMVWSYLDNEYADQPRTGIFMFDYPGWKLIEKVISFNKEKVENYRGKIVQWDNDRSEPKTSWLVGADGKRRWIHDGETYKCLKDVGLEDPKSVSSDILQQLDDLNNVWATCGSDRIGPNGALERRSYLKSGDCLLSLTESNLQVFRKGERVWSTGKGGEQLILQPDGNIVIYDNSRKPTWATDTNDENPSWLILGGDCTLRLYNRNYEIIWESMIFNNFIKQSDIEKYWFQPLYQRFL